MAYKDEYEVARLHAAPEFMQRLRRQFSGDFNLSFHLAPPLLSRLDTATGRPRKRAFGSWVMMGFRILRKFKFLRGTPFDPFGHTTERRTERWLIEDYLATIPTVLDGLNQERLGLAIKIASAAQDIRGFGPVKDIAVKEYRIRKAEWLASYEDIGAKPAVAADAELVS